MTHVAKRPAVRRALSTVYYHKRDGFIEMETFIDLLR